MINVMEQIYILTEEFINYLKVEKYENVKVLFSDQCNILVNGILYNREQLIEVFLMCKKQLGSNIAWNMMVEEIDNHSGFVYANLEANCDRVFGFSIIWTKTGYRWFINHMHLSWGPFEQK